MGLVINNNPASINAQRNLSTANTNLNKSLSRLSSGLRIVSAGDDAAGLAISESLRSQVASLEQASRNSMDGISMLQIAEGALNEVSSKLVRLRELTMQSANGTVSDDQKDMLDSEFQALTDEIDRIAKATNFNGTKLLDGSTTSVTFQVDVGTTADVDTFAVTLTSALASDLGISTLDISSSASADTDAALTAIDDAISSVVDIRSEMGAAQNRLQTTINNLGIAIENSIAAESRIRDVDVAKETSQMIKYQIIQQAGISVLSQANMNPQIALGLLQG